eukprot:COSAG01_NODE_14_length_41020_cov_40.702133_20_plen_434_part_00
MLSDSCFLDYWAKKSPASPFIYLPDQTSITYDVANKLVNQVVAYFSNLEFSQGDRIILACTKQYDQLILLLAAWRVGLLPLLLNPQLPISIQDDIKDYANAKYIFTQLPSSFSSPSNLTLESYNLSRIACLIQTSGSSGNPKLAGLSLFALFSSAYFSNQVIPLSTSDVWLLSLPLHHVSGLGILCRCLIVGAAIYIDKFDVQHLSNRLISHISVVSHHAISFVDDAKSCSSHLKALLLGGAPMATSNLNKLCELKFPLFISYGCTEFSSQIATKRFHKNDTLLLPLLPHVYFKLNQKSQVMIMGKSLFLGYWDSQTNSFVLELDDAGFFNTGDYATCSKSSLISIKKIPNNRLISGGENLDINSIAYALASLPNVKNVRIEAIDHVKYGQRPIAFLCYSGQKFPDHSWFKAQLKDKLTKFQIPDYFYSNSDS